jgi:hypothetical protein
MQISGWVVVVIMGWLSIVTLKEWILK